MKGLVRNLLRGVAAGAVGTAAMDALLYRRYRRGGGTDNAWRWESAASVRGWDGAPAPAQVGQQVERLAIGNDPPATWARSTTNAVHWATGIGWAIPYAVLATATSNHAWLRAAAFGPVVWLSGYVVLPLAKVYEPIWKYDARTLADDLSAHIVYGTMTTAAFAALVQPASTD